jgi:hypothetical protein
MRPGRMGKDHRGGAAATPSASRCCRPRRRTSVDRRTRRAAHQYQPPICSAVTATPPAPSPNKPWPASWTPEACPNCWNNRTRGGSSNKPSWPPNAAWTSSASSPTPPTTSSPTSPQRRTCCSQPDTSRSVSRCPIRHSSPASSPPPRHPPDQTSPRTSTGSPPASPAAAPTSPPTTRRGRRPLGRRPSGRHPPNPTPGPDGPTPWPESRSGVKPTESPATGPLGRVLPPGHRDGPARARAAMAAAEAVELTGGKAPDRTPAPRYDGPDHLSPTPARAPDRGPGLSR